MSDIIKKIFYLLPKGDTVKVAILFLMMLVAALVELGGIGMIPAFVGIVAVPDKILTYELLKPIWSYFNIQNAQDLLIFGALALGIVFILKSAYILFYAFIEARFLFNRKYMLGHRLMSTYMKAPYTFHLNKNSSELVRNISSEVSIVINSVLYNLLKISKDGLMTVTILGFLFYYEPVISLLVILFSGLGAGSFVFFTQKKMKKYGQEELGYRKKMIQAIYQGMLGIKEARVLNREKEFINQFSDAAQKSARLKTYTRFINQIPRPVIETTAVFGMILVSLLMVWEGRSMGGIITTLTLFAIAVVRLMPAIRSISSVYTNLQYNIAALEPVYNDLKQLNENTRQFLKNRKNSKKVEMSNSIEIKKLSYSYPGSNEKALDDISLTIPKGKAIGFVGESGAGKTTIIDLILGLMKPSEGQIMIDGRNIHENLSGWQKSIGYIPQSIFLNDDTLRRNIAFGLPEDEIDENKVLRAVELAQLNKLLENLSQGLDTIIGENGTRLSGGQKQRVGIARALYHDPDVLVMDEATSALDNITEKQITSAIESLMGERTVIMIAHRLTTVMNCDRLYLMEEGKVIQEGKYRELVEKNAHFREMAMET